MLQFLLGFKSLHILEILHVYKYSANPVPTIGLLLYAHYTVLNGMQEVTLHEIFSLWLFSSKEPAWSLIRPVRDGAKFKNKLMGDMVYF
jgi:hypothetical protein